MDTREQVAFQRSYYSRTAGDYDRLQCPPEEMQSYDLSVRMLLAWMPVLNASSILDVGAGTGRLQRQAKELGSTHRILGVEPVEELRRIGHEHGIPPDQLIAGDATRLDFPDKSFDVVTAFSLMHHLPNPNAALREMSRVARKAVIISDANNYAQGSLRLRWLKQGLWRSGLWPAVNWLRTKGKGYSLSEGDGLAYSYSVFDSIPELRKTFAKIFLVPYVPLDSGNLHVSANALLVIAAHDYADPYADRR